jgi:hypothetical protein
VQQAGAGSENTSKKKKKKYERKETMRTATLEPVSEDVALRKFDKSLPHMKRFFDVKDGGLNGACPLGPHEGDPIPWNQCHCLKGKPQRGGGTTQTFHVDVTSMVIGGAGGEIYKAMHKGAKSPTCLREIWQNKTHFRVHLLAEREKAMKAKIQTLEAKGAKARDKALTQAKLAKITTFAQRAGQEPWVEAVMAMDNNFDEGDMFGCVTLESVQVAMEEVEMVYHGVGNEYKCAELSPYECCDCSMRHMIQLQREQYEP